jgi:ABC-type polysaccharide/polyol phosphate export permease
MSFKNNFLVFKALLKRDIKLIVSNFTSILIDSVILSSCYILLFGFLLPAFGMEKTFSLPLFLGSAIITIISISFTRTVNIKSDIEFKKFIDYHLSLPISKNWLIFEYITAFVIDLFFSSIPSLIIGILILNDFEILNLLNFIPIYIISLLFFATFFLFLAFSTNWLWFISNTWERMLVPMIHLGCILYIWVNLMKFSNFFGQLVLINPVTYIAEGYRSAFFKTGYIPVSFCSMILLLFCIIMFFLLRRSFNKFLDPV